MEEKLNSEGKCFFCGKTFAKAGINRHLISHLNEISQSGKPGESFLVKVETYKRWGDSPFFLSLWIDGEAAMKTIDKFLRDIWLECCGHLSAFRYPARKSALVKTANLMKAETGEIPMSRKAKDVLYKGLELDYDYDFGSTTKLTMTVMDEYSVKADKKIVLLSRNEPLQIMCSDCGKVPATQICTVCMYEDEAVFCDKCAKKHAKKCEDFADYASSPVVNSPRMGVCAYEGGTIDTERDVVFVLKK